MLKKLAALTILLILAGCTLNQVTPTVPPKSRDIRVAFPTGGDAADVPSLMAHELLQAQGYNIQPLFFTTPDLEVAAVANGEADLSNGSTRTHWAAAQKGADIVTIMEQAGNVWSLVARSDIKTCVDLDGKKFGVQSAGSISNALLQAYLRKICPTAKPEVLFIQGSDVRAAAMEKGELDGAPLQLADVLAFQKSNPGEFSVLFDYAASLPQLKTNGVYATRKFATEHPEIVRDYVRALLTIHRRIRENPQLLYDALVKYLKMDAEAAKQVGDAYLAHNIWDLNGDLSEDDVKYSLDFFVEIGNVPPGLETAKITDVSYLNSVLDEIGRK